MQTWALTLARRKLESCCFDLSLWNITTSETKRAPSYFMLFLPMFLSVVQWKPADSGQVQSRNRALAAKKSARLSLVANRSAWWRAGDFKSGQDLHRRVVDGKSLRHHLEEHCKSEGWALHHILIAGIDRLRREATSPLALNFRLWNSVAFCVYSNYKDV